MSLHSTPRNKRRSKRQNAKLPHFEPFVNKTAGPSARGIRVGFPASRTVEMNYCDTITVSGPTGTIGKHYFRLNSVFDPDQTGTGHQPMGFDQWASFYNHYVVEECAYEVLVTQTSGVPIRCYTYISDDAATPSTYSDLLELGAASSYVVVYGEPHTFRGKVNIAEFFNRTSIGSDPELRAAVTTNPSEQAYLSIGVQHIDGASDAQLYVQLKLTYKVRFMEPIDLAPSVQKQQPSDLLGVPRMCYPCPEGYTMVPAHQKQTNDDPLSSRR